MPSKSASKTRRRRRTRVSRKRTYISSKIPPKRSNVIYSGRGGAVFPSSLSPQSYLPYNDFSQDPNQFVVNARLTQPFLTGVAIRGGSKKKSRKQTGNRGPKKQRGGNLAYAFANDLNATVGQITGPGLITGVDGVAASAATLSGVASAYNTDPVHIAPLA